MASKEKLPAWIQENVPDDAVWSEYYLIARKEETRRGNRVLINQTLKEPREVSISGKEVKGYLRDQSSPTIGVVLIVIGLAVVTLMMVLKTLGTSGGYLLFQLLIAVGFAGGGIYLLLKSRQLSAKLRSIDSWEALEPLIELALTDKVYNAEIAARKEEEGEQGAAYAGYFCIPAHAAVREDFEKAKSNFGLQENIRTSLVQAAAAIPAEGQKLVKNSSTHRGEGLL